MSPVIPRQIRDQIQAANSAMVEAGLLPPTTEGEGTPPTEPAIQPTPGEPAVEPSTEPVDIQPAPGEPAVQPPVTPPSNPVPVDWEHRYNSMKGRFDVLSADLTRLTTENAALRERLAKPATPPAAPAPVPADFELTDEERRDYGDDFVKVIEKRAKAAVHTELTELRTVTDQLRRQMEGVSVSTAVDAKTRMIQNLDLLPFDWRAVNDSDSWKLWLSNPDPLSGLGRQDLLMKAWGDNDAARVSRFFEGYLKETPMAPPGPQRSVGAPPAEPARTPALSLESLAAPGSVRSGAAASAAPPAKPIFTAAQLGRFYADKASGKYRGKEAEAAALAKQIDEAITEGRVSG